MRENEVKFSVPPVEACDEVFSTCPYLFASQRVARAHPDLVESRVVAQFRSVVPNRPYSARVRPLRGHTVAQRWAAGVVRAGDLVARLTSSALSRAPQLLGVVSHVISWMTMAAFRAQ